jgi:hypothetical protein
MFLQIAEDIDMKKKDVNGVMREFRVTDAQDYPPTGKSIDV